MWSKDEFCDDENNNAGCNYDGGACCGPNVNRKFCIDCKCHQDIFDVYSFQFARSLGSDNSNFELNQKEKQENEGKSISKYPPKILVLNEFFWDWTFCKPSVLCFSFLNLSFSDSDCQSTYKKSGETYCAIPMKHQKFSFDDAKKQCR